MKTDNIMGEQFNIMEDSGRNMWELAETLMPIYRTLVSPGFEESLRCINEYLSINVKKYSSGKKIFDWTIPPSWIPIAGYLKDLKGNRLIDFKDEPFFIAPYSISVNGIFRRKELFKHTATLPHLPDAVPLCPVYYDRNWRIGIPHSLKEKMNDEEYRVNINTKFEPGSLCIGECYLEGKSEKEILITTYLCHPHEANDNISGVVVATELFKILKKITNLFYSYRLIIIPETIGSITYLYHHRKEMKNVIGGYAITCVGDDGHITFKKSWKGDSLMDRVAIATLNERNDQSKVIEYNPISGSDERQFNAPGFRVSMPTIMRTPPACFREYHSSFDDLQFINEDNLVDSLQFILHTIDILENNCTYINNYKTEPFLSGYGIFQKVRWGEYGVFHKEAKIKFDVGSLNQIIIHETDGKQDVLSIAEKSNYPFSMVEACSRKFEKAGLVARLEKV
ncbi:MAG: hypothetical protein CMM60_04930 [Rhodospirillaceae bacterium]|nr:hypothetical protein [Rhodospirillaceae bacterium]|tara:strand:- start:2692 stop:4047 length:1356 start_codon:yes stop_codon:yes gene_type:complete